MQTWGKSFHSNGGLYFAGCPGKVQQVATFILPAARAMISS
jgi:hypothetical protein